MTDSRMKIALVISALGRGGAERQLMRLAHGLGEHGHNVEVWCYGGSTSLDDELRHAGIHVRNGSGSRRSKIATLRSWMADYKPDVIHCFMKRASGLSVLARGARRRPVVIGSDLSTATYGRRDLTLWLSLLLFVFTQRVVTQTKLNQHSLHRLAPWLRGKTYVIRNGLDLRRFVPADSSPPEAPFRFASVGTVYAIKNPLRTVEAVGLLVEQGNRNFVLDWYGRLGLAGDDQPSDSYLQCMRRVKELGLESYVRFHGECAQIADVYRKSHALVHPSVQEGFPNAVVEGMASGLPILVSRVSDLPLVVEEARNGKVFDEDKPRAIADAMAWMLDQSTEARKAMGQRSRRLSQEWFGLDRFLNEYENLYRDLLTA